MRAPCRERSAGSKSRVGAENGAGYEPSGPAKLRRERIVSHAIAEGNGLVEQSFHGFVHGGGSGGPTGGWSGGRAVLLSDFALHGVHQRIGQGSTWMSGLESGRDLGRVCAGMPAEVLANERAPGIGGGSEGGHAEVSSRSGDQRGNDFPSATGSAPGILHVSGGALGVSSHVPMNECVPGHVPSESGPGFGDHAVGQSLGVALFSPPFPQRIIIEGWAVNEDIFQ